jgi:hypothetical protein
MAQYFWTIEVLRPTYRLHYTDIRLKGKDDWPKLIDFETEFENVGRNLRFMGDAFESKNASGPYGFFLSQ